jgi:hypothetical protein
MGVVRLPPDRPVEPPPRQNPQIFLLTVLPLGVAKPPLWVTGVVRPPPRQNSQIFLFSVLSLGMAKPPPWATGVVRPPQDRSKNILWPRVIF